MIYPIATAIAAYTIYTIFFDESIDDFFDGLVSIVKFIAIVAVVYALIYFSAR